MIDRLVFFSELRLSGIWKEEFQSYINRSTSDEFLPKSQRDGEEFVLMYPTSFQNMSHVDEPVSAEEMELMCKLPYVSVIGHLQYLNTCTRPDLAYVVSKPSQYLTNPGLMHWQAAVRVLQYLEATKLVGLRYTGGLEKSAKDQVH